MEKVPMTIGGHAKLEEELKHRTSVERPRIIQAISEARAMATFPKTPNTTPPRKPRATMRAASTSLRTSFRGPR